MAAANGDFHQAEEPYDGDLPSPSSSEPGSEGNYPSCSSARGTSPRSLSDSDDEAVDEVGAPVKANGATGQKRSRTSASSRSSSTSSCGSLFTADLEGVEWWTGLTEADVQKALDIDKGAVGDGWTMVKESDGGKVWKKTLEGQSNQLVKGVIQLPGIPTAKTVELVSSPTIRPQWDSNYHCRILDEHPTEGGHPQLLQHLILKMPPPVTDRDFVHVTYRHDDPGGQCALLSKSVEHPSLQRRSKSNVIRAKTHLAAVIIRPLDLTGIISPSDVKKYGGAKVQLSSSSELTLIVHLDLFGKIPAAAVNHSIVSQPLKWRTKMMEFYHKKTKK